jgi:hypothetical protein
MNDLCAIRAKDRYGAALLAGINFHDICPSNIFVLPKPEDLLHAVGGNGNRSRERKTDRKRYCSHTYRDKEIQWSPVAVLQSVNGRIAKVGSDQEPSPKCAPVLGEFYAPVVSGSRFPLPVVVVSKKQEHHNYKANQEHQSGNKVAPDHPSILSRTFRFDPCTCVFNTFTGVRCNQKMVKRLNLLPQQLRKTGMSSPLRQGNFLTRTFQSEKTG